MIINLKDYLEKLEKIQIDLNELPDLDEKSFEFYEEIYEKIDEEYDRVNELLEENENHIPRID